MEIGFKGYKLSRGIDTSKIEEQQKRIEGYKLGKYASFVIPFLQAFNNLVNLDYVIKSDKLEDVDYGEAEADLRDIKYGLITNSGILAFQYSAGKQLDENQVFGFRNNTDFGLAINTILKMKDSKFKFITLDNLKKFYKRSKITGKYRTCQLLDSFVRNTHLVFINTQKQEFKVLPNKNHMLALSQIIEFANLSRDSGDKLSPHALEVISKILFAGTDREGESGIGAFRSTNVRVGYDFAWEPVILRRVVERDDLGNPIKYDNSPLTKEVKEALDWVNKSDLPPIIKASVLNLEISRIQPFRDGNKRISRLFTNYELLCAGYPIVAFRTDSKASYDDHLSHCINTKDITDFAEYLVHMIDLQQQAYLSEIETLVYYLEDDQEAVKVQEGGQSQKE